MKLMHKTILLVGLLVFSVFMLSACKKVNRNRSLHVQLVEAGTLKPLPGFRVDMYYYKSGSSYFNGSKIQYASAYTDAQGKVFVDGSEYDPDELRLYAPEPKEYYDINNGGDGRRGVPGLIGDLAVIEMYPYAWLGLYVDFSVYKNEFDYVSFNFGDLAHGKLYGNDTIFPDRVRGNTITKINFFGIKNGLQVKTWQNEVYCSGHDTTFFTPIYPVN